jgi:hypothetical protein
VNLGTNACGDEAAAQPAVQALTAPLVTTDNAGFLRYDAVLAIIVVSDAGDQSPQPAAFYANTLRNLKDPQHPDQFTYSDIGPFNPTPPPNCTYDDFTDTSKNDYLVTQFNGVKEEICTPDWGTTLQALGQRAFGYHTHFYLTAAPDMTAATPLAVTFNDGSGPQPLAPDAGIWTYDAAANALIFAPTYTPGPGDVVTVTYFAPCN